MRRILVSALFVAGCGGGSVSPPGVPSAAGPLIEPEQLEPRALLLLLVDQQIFDPFSARQALTLDPVMRIEAARAIARAGDPRGRSILEDLIDDDSVEVRRQATFGLGVLGDEEAVPRLLQASRDADRETGTLAVEALAKLEAPITTVLDSLEPLPAEELWPRLAPSLFRFPIEEALPVIRRALIGGGAAVYRDAMYALARNAGEESAPILRDLLRDPDPWLRGWAARALGRIGSGEDVARLAAVTADGDAGVVVQALRSIRRLVASGAVAPSVELRATLATLMNDPRAAVRLTAIETAGAWQRDETLGPLLADRFATSDGRERELALLALAASQHPRIGEWLGVASSSPDGMLRRRAAAAAALVGDDRLLARLAADGAAAVRAAAVGELLRLDEASPEDWALGALQDPDPVVRATAFDWVREHPVLPATVLLTALAGMGKTDIVEAQLSALGAVEARAAAEEEDREIVVAALTLLAAEAEPVLRRRAGEALETLGEARPAAGPAAPARGIGVYRDLVLQASQPRVVRLSTGVGEIDVRLDCERAPLTCVNFLQLVNQGFYDGLTFHRVVHDFVIQGGDPRGDGYGGPGYMIRDEINRARYRRGSVGMALAGPDTGGSQFFIALSPQPHLDGSYTVFGQVAAGDEILDRVVQGEIIREAREIPPGS